MELKQYLGIVWKRAWIPGVLLVLVVLVSLANQHTPAPIYAVSMRFIVGVQPERIPKQFNYDGYYAAVASEYAADDLAVIVSSNDFTTIVNRYLADMGSTVTLSPGTIQGLLVEKQHRVLTLHLSWGNPDQLSEIGQAITNALQHEGEKNYLPLLSTFGGIIKVIDPPSVPVAVPTSLTERLDLPLRLLLAMGMGIALTFLLDYLDDRIHHRRDLEGLGIAVLAEVSDGN